MIGRILGVNPEEGSGTISADNGSRYGFTKESWNESFSPERDVNYSRLTP